MIGRKDVVVVVVVVCVCEGNRRWDGTLCKVIRKENGVCRSKVVMVVVVVQAGKKYINL